MKNSSLSEKDEYFLMRHIQKRGRIFISSIGSSFSTSTPGIKSDADNLSYGYDLNRGLYPFKGDLGPLYIYHKELTAAEVLENYNALKDRFV